jgi:hypothetical protein
VPLQSVVPVGQTHWYDELHDFPPVHEAHVRLPPHPFGGEPHWAPAAAHDASGVQTHVPPEHVSLVALQLPPAQHA